MINESSRCCCQLSRVGLYNLLKTLLILYNMLFMLLGMSLIGLGIYAELMRQQLTEADHEFVTPSVLLFILGSVLTIFAMIGFWGSLRDLSFLLKLFNLAVGVCIILEIIFGSMALIFKDPAKDFVNSYVLKGLTTYYDDHDLKNIVDFIQEEFKCCGGRLYKDWVINPYHNCSSPGPSACGVPYSCCVKHSDEDYVVNSMCGYDTILLKPFEAVEFIYLTGCIDAVIDYIWGHLNVLIGIVFGVLLPQVFGIIVGLMYLDVLRKIIESKESESEQPKLLDEQL